MRLKCLTEVCDDPAAVSPQDTHVVDGVVWHVDVAADGTAYTWAPRGGCQYITSDELPEELP